MNRFSDFSRILKQRQQGFTLIEIMVALVLGLILLAGIIQLFLGSKQTYRFHDALSRVQENGRFALEKMTRDLRMAGYQPAGNTVAFGTPIQGVGNNQITVAWYDNGAAISRKYVLNTGDSGKSALFFSANGGADQELVEGVENMQISYGEDINADNVADSYKAAGAVVNWSNVVSVRIELLLASLETNIVATNQTLTFPPAGSLNSASVTIADRRLPQIFSTTVGLRNRLH